MAGLRLGWRCPSDQPAIDFLLAVRPHQATNKQTGDGFGWGWAADDSTQRLPDQEVEGVSSQTAHRNWLTVRQPIPSPPPPPPIITLPTQPSNLKGLFEASSRKEFGTRRKRYVATPPSGLLHRHVGACHRPNQRREVRGAACPNSSPRMAPTAQTSPGCHTES